MIVASGFSRKCALPYRSRRVGARWHRACHCYFLMTTFEEAALLVWKVVLIALLAVTLMSIVAANRPVEPASWSLPPHVASPFAGPVLRTV